MAYPPSTISSTARNRPSIFSSRARFSTFFLKKEEENNQSQTFLGRVSDRDHITHNEKVFPTVPQHLAQGIKETIQH